MAVQVTREGGWFLGVTALVGVAALGLASNLLLLLFALLAALAATSLALAARSLRGVTVRRWLPLGARAGEALRVTLAVRNDKRGPFSSVFSLDVEDHPPGSTTARRCWFLKVPAGREQRASYRHVFARRGRQRFGVLRVGTSFPLGLFHVSRPVPDEGDGERASEAERVVLPRRIAVVPPQLVGLDEGDDDETERRWSQAARGGQVHGLRLFRHGDDARDIHWRSSARRGRLLVRERERRAARRVVLLLDNGLPVPCEDEALLDGLERAVERAAALAEHWLRRGVAVRVVTRGGMTPWTTGGARLGRLLHALALLPAMDEGVPFPFLSRASSVAGCRVTPDGVLPLPSMREASPVAPATATVER